MQLKRTWLILGVMMAGLLFLSSTSAPALAITELPVIVIDDFNDGDVGDWGYFGGNNAGGGFGPAGDRPYEGANYLSTGWGGNGSDSVFYGGIFKNLPDTGQVVLPADPWFNIWVYNQSDATVDGYTLEITIREDLDGNGWSGGTDESFRYDASFTSSDFDDTWTLVSVPLSSFFRVDGAGDGAFTGNLDEVVLVIAGVSGPTTPPGTAIVEVDFDQLSFSSGGPAASSLTVFDDMEHGDPNGAGGYFIFFGPDAGGGVDPNGTDLPPVDGGSFSIQTGWGGANPGFYGGFGRTNPIDLTATDTFSFWINPDANQSYTLEINLQDDDDGNNTFETAADDEFQFNCVVSPAGPCAVAGGGWQLIDIPLSSFFDDNSQAFGNGVLDAVSVARGGNGQLINVVIAVIGDSAAVNFRTDYWVFDKAPDVGGADVIQDYEGSLAPNIPCPPATPVTGFCTFNGAGSSVALSLTTTPPVPSPGGASSVLAMDIDSTSFAGFIEGFEVGGEPAPQDWSTREGISFWMYGNNTGREMFIDILDNRNPDSTTDDAERFTVAFNDDFSGWQLIELPFTGFVRKEVGNGAPADGLTLFEMHGYAFGGLDTGGAQTYYFDDISLYGEAEPPAPAVNFALQNTFIEEGTTGEVAVKLNRPLGPSDPDQVSIDYATERSYAEAGKEYTPTSGTLTFVKGGATELTFPVETFDDTKFEGDEQIVIRLTNPVDVERGALFQGSVLIDDNDPFDPNMVDDFVNGAYLWDGNGIMEIDTLQIPADDPWAYAGQDQFEMVMRLVPVSGQAPRLNLEQLETDVLGLLPTGDAAADAHLMFALGHLDSALADSQWDNDYYPAYDTFRDVWYYANQMMGELARAERRANRSAPASVAGIQAAQADLASFVRTQAELQLNIANNSDAIPYFVAQTERMLDRGDSAIENGKIRRAFNFYSRALENGLLSTTGVDEAGATVMNDFPKGRDWSLGESVSFWYYGSGTGEDVTVTLKDNRAPDPGPDGWSLVWADEFNEEAGTPPNPANWAYEIGDTTPDGKNGWGNEEFQYYTDDPKNAQTDGNGNLVITLDEADGSQECYYGPCQYESARLITQNRAEFAYGRIESRQFVPTGGDGLWPAFWSLGTDITYNPWPGAGEIDIMEYVSRIPNEIFGTIHGPGYAGGASYGDIVDLGERVDGSYHTYAVEWEPEMIRWYFDGELYHTATPADVAPNPWVFEKEFFLLLNFAIGGNFGGQIDPNNTYPQEFLVDYVRVYQGPDTAERFEATFVDDTEGWVQVEVPFTDFTRSTVQPAGAPNDGLNLTEVWGLGMTLPAGVGETKIDQVALKLPPAPEEVVVTTNADTGEGSLREALAIVADGGTITFDPSIAPPVISLTSDQLVIDRDVTIDGSDLPGLVVSGAGNSRVFQVNGDADVSMSNFTIADGVAAPQGGGILNYGTITLTSMTVANNTESGAGPDFQNGGGGIYNGDGATMNLVDSVVTNNSSVSNPGGGVFGFFNSTMNITNSIISNNTSGDVAGGVRSLGNTTTTGSTISGNTGVAWHGSGMFLTDGTHEIVGSTIVNNAGPAGTGGGIMVATFGAPVSVTIQGSTVLDNLDYNCQVEGGATAVLTSLGGNTFDDASCNPDVTDTIIP